jgi:hypothetical protein
MDTKQIERDSIFDYDSAAIDVHEKEKGWMKE